MRSRKTIIHVNQAVIKENKQTGRNEPPLIVRTYKGRVRAHEIECEGPVTFKHSPDKPLACGARVWAETYGEVKVVA